MYTCKDCLHYNACKSMYIHGLDEYTAVMNYQEDIFDNEHYADVYNCEDFTHKDAWIHLPCKVGDTFYYINQDIFYRKDQSTKTWELTDDYCIHEGQISSIDYSGNVLTFYDLDGIDHIFSEMFFTREDAEDKLKEIKGD